MNSRKVIFDKQKSAVIIVKERTPEEGQLLLKARYSLMSLGTEMTDYLGNKRGGAAYPSNPGYSLTGEVIEIGGGVSNFKKGDLVWSLANHETYPLADAADCVKLSEKDDPSDATFLALGKVALHGIRRLDIKINEPVAVFGLGLVGLLSVQLAKLCGANPVIGVDLAEERCAVAGKCGADITVNPLKEDPVEAIKKATGGKGAGAIVEASGSDRIFPYLFKAAAYAGRIAMVGGLHKDVMADFFTDFQVKELTIMGCRQVLPYRATPFDKWDLPANYNSVLELIRNGMLNVKPYVSKTIRLDDTLGVYKDLGEGRNRDYLGVLIDYSK